MRVRVLSLKSAYWRPGTAYQRLVLDMIKDHVKDGDIVVISEKAIATALGNLADESKLKPGKLAYLLARLWIRFAWGYLLGAVSRMSLKNIQRLRYYPLEEGARHKQLCLRTVGLLHALKHWSEGGIDASNLPGSMVMIPLAEGNVVAKKLKEEIRRALRKRVMVMIVDSDKTFTFRNVHFASRRTDVKGIINIGPLAFILGRALKLRARSTPIAVSEKISVNLALNVAAVANKARGSGMGRTVWDASARFNVPVTQLTWEMLESNEHRPVTLVRLWPNPAEGGHGDGGAG
ncbi:MAG: coenzyme F420-0:L-glutamate ligase [Candidatus Bathyarchaeia archaeon]